MPGKTTNSGLKISIDVRPSDENQIKDFSTSHPNIKNMEDAISIFKEIIPVKMRGKPLNIDTGKKMLKWEPLKDASSVGWLTYSEGLSTHKVLSYQKIMPLIDAYGWMRDKERPSKPFFWNFQKYDIVAPENQAYVDCLASYAVSKLRTHIKSPHFCEFYGAVRGVADLFYYNMEEDFEDFRFTTWFWDSLDKGEFNLRVIEKSSGKRLTLEEIKTNFKPDDEFLHDDDDTDDSKSFTSSLSAESLQLNTTLSVNDMTIDLDDAVSIKTSSETVRVNKRLTPRTVHSMSTASNESFSDDYDIHAELIEMPVAIQYLEYCEGTVDELLEQSLYSPIVNAQQESIWSAWLFQICAACSQLQNILRLTHNDLHTCNVLWKKTTEEFLYYNDSNGRHWKVPTYGYCFSIIDYGRSIFALNNFFIVSSDYNDGHDAYGMYNFGPIEDTSMPKILPNKSFDLCRLACSLLRGIYPKNPSPNPKGKILTKEGVWEVRETNHPVFNLLWSWLKTKKSENVLEKQNGEEKYPGFDLYMVIAKEIDNAIPELQLGKFSNFIMKKAEKDKQSIFIY